MDLLDIQYKLQDTVAAIAKTEGILAKRLNDPVPNMNLVSLRRRQIALEEQFLEASARLGLDVCAYRVFAASDAGMPIRGIANALADFQNLFSLVYDALKNGPKKIAYLNVATVERTTFNFGYSYPGSLGVVLTMPEQMNLFGGELDITVTKLFDLSKAKTSAEIAAYAKELGAASIRAMYKWASNQVNDGLGADIQWRRSTEFVKEVFIQSAEFGQLQAAIEETSEKTSDTRDYRGLLLGGDVKTGTFHFKPDKGRDMHGGMSPNILNPVLGRRYIAKITTTTTTRYATEQEQAEYFLLDLSSE